MEQKLTRWGRNLMEDALHDDHGDREIDDEAGDVDKGGDEGCGGSCGVCADFFQDDGEHAAGNGAPEHNADERDTYRDGYEDTVWAIRMGEDQSPQHDAGEADNAKDSTEQEPGHEFTPDDAEPVGNGEFAECHGLDDEGRCLGAAIAAAGNDEGYEEGKDDSFRDLVFEVSHGRGSEHF